MFNSQSEIESGTGAMIAESVLSPFLLDDYIGKQCFERICKEYLMIQNQNRRWNPALTSFGKWWGADKVLKVQSDIDLVAANKFTKNAVLCECKWRNEAPSVSDIEKLLNKNHLLTGYETFTYIFFAKQGFSKQIKNYSKIKMSYCLFIIRRCMNKLRMHRLFLT